MILRPLFQWRPYRGEGILATVVKGMATIRHIRIDQCHILCVDDKGNITLMMDSIHTIHFTSGVDDQYFRWSDPFSSLGNNSKQSQKVLVYQ